MVFESEFAKSIFSSKYLLSGETTAEQAVERVVKAVSSIYPEIEDDARSYISKQWFVPAGGIWRAAGNPDKHVSFVNCTTLNPIDDNLESIGEHWYQWAKYAAFGQGEGVHLGRLRPRDAVVHNSSRSSTGSVPWMHTFDAIMKVVAQHGRRGATLVSQDCFHPDIEEFVKSKSVPETLESMNISVHTTDAFMEAVEKNDDWDLHFENKYESIHKVIKANDLFMMTCDQAWKSGEPGLQFIDTARRCSNSDALGFPIVSTNACSEQWLDPDNVCMLSHINLAKFTEYGIEGFRKLVAFGVRFLHAVIQLEYQENRSPLPSQHEKLKTLPRMGLGITGFADYLFDKKIPYGSESSIDEVDKIGRELAHFSYLTGYELGKKYGSFVSYDKEKFQNSGFVKHLLEEGILEDYMLDYQACVAYNTIAPVGSGSIISNVSGSGIEPAFSKYLVRRERATSDDWREWFIFTPYVERYLRANGLDVTRENAEALSDSFWTMSYDVDPLQKVKLIATLQKYIDSSISVTFNMPKNGTVEEIKKIYFEAWREGLKGVTVYREGSRTGVLITEKNYKESKEAALSEKEIHRESTKFSKRPNPCPCDIYQMSYKGQKFVVLVGIVDEKPYEIFVSTLSDNFDVNGYKHGFTKKIKSGHYELQVENGSPHVVIQNIGKVFDSAYASLSRMVSIALQEGAPVERVITQLNRESTVVAFEKVITRVLKKYIKDYTKSGETCPNCGGSLVYINGCVICPDPNCGYSRCE